MADAGADQYTFHLEATGKNKHEFFLIFMPVQMFIIHISFITKHQGHSCI